MRLIRERADEFGVRRERVGMIGFSAGGTVTSGAVFGPTETRPDFAATHLRGRRNRRRARARRRPSSSPPRPMIRGQSARSIELFSAWRKANALAELHIFQIGAHGFVNKGGGADHFMDRLEEWLRVNKLLSRPAN